MEKLTKGPVIDPSIRIVIPTPWVRLRREPLGEYAKELLADLLRHMAFWEAVEVYEYPVEFAGNTHLNVKKRQAEKIFKELNEAGGPLQLFRLKAVLGFQSRRIAPGRVTTQCRLADMFFGALDPHIAELKSQAFGVRTSVTIEEACESMNELQREVIEYIVCKYISDPPARKGR